MDEKEREGRSDEERGVHVLKGKNGLFYIHKQIPGSMSKDVTVPFSTIS